MKIVCKNSELQFRFYQPSWKVINLTDETVYNKFINSNAEWEASGYCYIIRIGDSEKIKVQANYQNNAVIAFLTVGPASATGEAAFCDGTSRITITKGTEEIVNVPSDCEWLYIYSGSTQGSHLGEVSEFS